MFPTRPAATANPVFDDWKDRLRNGFPVYVNAACFQVPAVGELGNSQRNGFTGPSQWNFNMSLQKGTRITRARPARSAAGSVQRVQPQELRQPRLRVDAGRRHVRGEVVLGTPNATAGQIDGIVGTMRQIQLGAKLTF